VFFTVLHFAPYSGKDAAMFWGMRLMFGDLAAVFAVWLNLRTKELPAVKNVEPLRNQRCLMCDGRMTDFPKWYCVDCGVIRCGD
jgi:hypothetical protein